MSDSFVFTSLCPKCRDVRSQRKFDGRTLRDLLNRDLPIEGYCVLCDGYWPITAIERAALYRALADAPRR